MTSKPLIYHGVRYTIAKGPGLISGRMCWMGIIVVSDGALRLVCEAQTKGEALKAIKLAVYPASQHAGRIRKLRRMTVKNGCSPAEASTARQMLERLGAGRCQHEKKTTCHERHEHSPPWGAWRAYFSL